jgi:16S rRNA U1498 N3-methylase RsmE
LYTIHKVEKKEIVFSIFDVVCIENDIDFTLDLYAAIPNKLDKMEYVVQK